MKKCKKCGKTKKISEFIKNKSRKDGIHSYCKNCHFLLNKLHKEELRDFIRSFKNKPCADCKNIFEWYIMEFDHIRGEKLFNVTSLPQFGSKKRILEEIEKCDIICANCHKIRTYNRLITG